MTSFQDEEDDHAFLTPVKLVKSPEDMTIWDKSSGYFDYLSFLFTINEAVKGKTNSQGSENPSPEILKLKALLDKMDGFVDEIPPIDQPQRFGNQAFKTWYQRIKSGAFQLLQEMLPETMHRAVPEIMVYLVEGFGNSTRIDYGTGHEMSFLMFVCCLFKIHFLKDSDRTLAGCYIFPQYLHLARKLQQTYRMEPAGSHGVWSLDDYQFVPFIWGSSQLINNPNIPPGAFVDDKVVNKHSSEYMFLSCIEYINQVKKGPFAEHSNQLWSISAVSTWTKINQGLIKMYKAEVLSKFPVIQHVYFGSLFTLDPAPPGASIRNPLSGSLVPPVITAGARKESGPKT